MDGGERERRVKEWSPLDLQREEAEKEGRIMRYLCGVFKFRVVSYIAAQPAVFVFLVTLVVIAVCMPFVAAYVAGPRALPDFYSMRIWNAYLGNLPTLKFCIGDNYDPHAAIHFCNDSRLHSYDGQRAPPPDNSQSTHPDKDDSPGVSPDDSLTKPSNQPTMNLAEIDHSSNSPSASSPEAISLPEGNKTESVSGTNVWENRTVSVQLEFMVNRKVVNYSQSISQNVTVELMRVLSGKDLNTKIKDNQTGLRIDEKVTVRIHIVLPKTLNASASCSFGQCKVNACVSITAPINAIPTRMPKIHEDFSFERRLLDGRHKPAVACNCSTLPPKDDVHRILLGRRGTDCRNATAVWPASETYRHHGLIVIHLTEKDQSTAAIRVLWASLLVALIALAFAITISCTDRPPLPKSSTE